MVGGGGDDTPIPPPPIKKYIIPKEFYTLPTKLPEKYKVGMYVYVCSTPPMGFIYIGKIKQVDKLRIKFTKSFYEYFSCKAAEIYRNSNTIRGWANNYKAENFLKQNPPILTSKKSEINNIQGNSVLEVFDKINNEPTNTYAIRLIAVTHTEPANIQAEINNNYNADKLKTHQAEEKKGISQRPSWANDR
jgi:hypothetical protein